MLDKISTISNTINSSLIQEFYQFMVDNRNSDSYKKNNLKVLILFGNELAPNVTFYDIPPVMRSSSMFAAVRYRIRSINCLKKDIGAS